MENENKRFNKYRIQLQEVQKKDGTLGDQLLEFEFENHDDIFTIVEVLKERKLFDGVDQTVEFAVGLKLFSEVMIRNRNHPLFEEFAPAFGQFMKKLKGGNK
ncbi:DUF3861 domain-containing protein [Fluviicola sp.]|uniref:DUF3861 domain-containing protein n=1 Tax=Fluviicola sp. TaxID=1917219 RepID=UPI0031D60536